MWRVNVLNPALIPLFLVATNIKLCHQTNDIFSLSKKKSLEVRLTSIQHRGLPAFVPHTTMVSLTFWMTVIKLSHSSCERKGREKKKKNRQKGEKRGKTIQRSERGITVSGEKKKEDG